MKIEIAEHGRMTESGSSLLRLIQNQDIPLLDLLVREAIQNSLDAAASNCAYVNVDISVGQFKSKELAKHLEKIENGLNNRFSSRSCKYIAVRDSNTVGLTGPVRYSEVRNNMFGNLLKLVYEICKPQQNEGAGGSWGLGKTIYFRLGIGLVLYYSRIYQNGKYQSRLAACLVEDETRSDALIPSSGVKRGIAWWGKQDGGIRSSSTIPLDNVKDIDRILSVFGIPQYEEKETGTTVIIPYIDEETLLNEVYAKNEPLEHKPYWVNSVPDYLKVAIQRWYAPRLYNSKYSYGTYLAASVNGKRIKVAEMLSTFRVVRELYILATGNPVDEESILSCENVETHVESIDLRGVLNTTSSGHLAYAKLSRKQLYMEPPHNEKSPYQHITNINLQMENGNGPIIMYTRRPGMIVGYDYDGQWTHRMPKSGPDEYIIGLFVANSLNTLKSIKDPENNLPITLEEYIRRGEKADHASWTDRNISGNNPRIVSSIQKNVINKIRKKYTEVQVDTTHKQNIGLGHALAEMLLPSEDFGNGATPPHLPGAPGKPPKPRSGRKSALRIEGNPSYSEGKVLMNIDISLRGKPVLLFLQVLTDFKRFDADTWELPDEIGKEFPMRLESLQITHVQALPRNKSNGYNCDMIVDADHLEGEDTSFSAEIRKSDVFGVAGYIHIMPKLQNCQLRGVLSFSFNDAGVRGGLDIKELEDE